MKKKISIKTLMIASILFSSVLTISFTILYCESKAKRLIKDRAKTIVLMQSSKNADAIGLKIDNYLSTLNAVAAVYANYYEEDEEDRMYITDSNNKKVGKDHPELINIKDVWDISDDVKYVSDPFMEKIPGTNVSTHMCKLTVPIIYDGSMVGTVSANIAIDSLLNGFENKFGSDDKLSVYITSDQGTILYCKKANERGKKLHDVVPSFFQKSDVDKYIKERAQFISENVEHSEQYVACVTPINISGHKSWTLCVMTPKASIMGEAGNMSLTSFLLIIMCLAILGFITILIANAITRSLNSINAALVDVSDGDIKNNNEWRETSMAEINNINESMKSVISGLIKAAEFSEQIGNGNLDTEFTALSANDKLGNALINMRDNLKKADEEAKERKIADEKVNWATLGLAKFGEILHTNNQNINDLSYDILRNLIKYIDVNQGAIYVLDDTKEEPVYEMTAAIAYDRRKFMQKRFAVGEDLVGRCAYEHKTIYMTDIPKDYINITSGMGSATASTLLLVPLVLNDNVFGIIELASFHNLEDYKINFVEKVAESIASTISTVKINERTNNLLNQSKVQAEELASKEEEMRQNMEELQATQEEAARRENESNAIMKVINDKLIVVEYDMSGVVTNVNDTYSKMLGVTADKIIGQKSDDGVDMTTEQRMSHLQMWSNLRRGKIETEINHITLNGRDLWIQETYTPVLDQNETNPYKVIKVGIDITEKMNAQNKINELQTENNESASNIADLEKMMESNGQAPASVAKAKKASKQKDEQVEESDLNREVGEQELIEWNENCETSIIEISEQLKKLTELANTVYTTFRAGKSKKEIKESVRSLADFASYHFGTVEGYVEESDFSDKKQLKQSFNDFVAKINEFLNLLSDGKIKSADGLMLFMTKWIKNDIEQMKLLADNLKK